ncbi:MAG: glycosyltransferase family 9 protein [Verrucomicrobia bacterium]|nr:glycosyltransferase family 9 protein [Verrucomicrobiota bacterium]
MKILVIRHDNIGDLIITTPVFRALRERFPDAQIDALVNSYNFPILQNNPDLSRIHVYTKGKHRSPGASLLMTHWRRFRLMLRLRSTHYDTVIVANWGYHPRLLRPARWIAPASIIGFVPARTTIPGISHGIPINTAPRHSVEKAFFLLRPLGIEGPPPPLRLVPDPGEKRRAQDLLRSQTWFRPDRTVVGVHISSRKELQRWTGGQFSELIKRLHAKDGFQFMLFWSPGDEKNRMHPGDDQAAASIVASTSGLPVLPYATGRLETLMGGLSVCDAMICSDGGAMHVGAGLGLPILCFFGDSPPQNWHPWGVPYELLNPATRNVKDIPVEDAGAAFERLMGKMSSSS